MHDPIFKNKGCDGGNALRTFYYIRDNGIALDREYMYKAKDEKCDSDKQKCIVKLNLSEELELKQVPQGDESALRKALLFYGPMIVTIRADLSSFQNYGGGVYADVDCKPLAPKEGGHDMLLIGYGTDEEDGDYWLLINTIGPCIMSITFLLCERFENLVRFERLINCGCVMSHDIGTVIDRSSFMFSSIFLFFAICASLTKYGLSEVSIYDFFTFDKNLGGSESMPTEYSEYTSFRRLIVNPPFTYFGKVYDSLWISPYGVITFTNPMPKSDDPTCHAEVRYYSTIAPYWVLAKDSYNVDNTTRSKIIWHYANLYGDATSNTVVRDAIKARKEIGNAFPAFQNITLKWVGVATWINMLMSERYYSRTDNPTFFTMQAALATDGVHSFAIFYYNKIDFSRDFTFFTGFDAGNRQDHYPIASSCSDLTSIRNLTTESNVGSPGKWVFRVDLPSILAPGSLCPEITTPLDGYCQPSDFTVGSEATKMARWFGQDLFLIANLLMGQLYI
ncbi:papain family cysteine protease domain-containing protein [Ditylenchus destructor]|nr:papain family cysteine protease domain-containing protein [Ditylenchus destructor]